jgi:hypothetical protein
MFGIMQPERSCSMDRNDPVYHYHRQHYCGTCKTMGQRYGQRSRLLLNFDTVFMAELLSDILEEDASQWANSFQTVNQCFHLPNSKTDIPFSLEYAGTVNVFLGGLKINDHQQDISFSWGWRSLRLLFSKALRRSQRQLQQWGAQPKELWALADGQQALENGAIPQSSHLSEHLSHYARPTAEITARLFAQAMEQANKGALKADFYQLGYAFGRLAYVLDAAEDRAKDLEEDQFNPFANYWADCLAEEHEQAIQDLVLDWQDEVVGALERLPLAAERLEIYAGRLMSNVAKRLAKPQIMPLTRMQRIQLRWQHAREFAEKMTCDSPQNGLTLVKQHIITLSVFMLPRTPQQIDDPSGIGFWGFLTAFLTTLGLTYGLSKLPISPAKKDKKKKRWKKGWWRPRNWFRKRPRGCCGQCDDACSECCFIFVGAFLGMAILGMIVGVIMGAVQILALNLVWGWVLFGFFGVMLMVLLAFLLGRDRYTCCNSDCAIFGGGGAHCCDMSDEFDTFNPIVLIASILAFITAAILGIVLATGAAATVAAITSGWILFGIATLFSAALIYIGLSSY